MVALVIGNVAEMLILVEIWSPALKHSLLYLRQGCFNLKTRTLILCIRVVACIAAAAFAYSKQVAYLTSITDLFCRSVVAYIAAVFTYSIEVA